IMRLIIVIQAISVLSISHYYNAEKFIERNTIIKVLVSILYMNMSNAMDKAFFILIVNHFRDRCALTRKPDATCNCIKFPGKFPFVWMLCICSNSHTHMNHLFTSL